MTMSSHLRRTAAVARIDRLRMVALVEGATLLALVGIAVPLKHLAGIPAAVSVMGPVHGAAFVFYAWRVVDTVSSDDWTTGEIAGLSIAALVPFGSLLSAAMLRRKAIAVAAGERAAPAGSVP